MGVQSELNNIHPLMDHGAGRIDILFAKLTALEHSVDAISDGAASQIGRLSAQIERLEKALAASSGVVFEPFPEIEDIAIEDPAPMVEEFVEKEDEVTTDMFAPVEEELAVEEDVASSVDSAATNFFSLFQDSAQITQAMPTAEPPLEIAPMQKEITKESGVLPRIATGREIMIQGFHWESHNLDWYKIVQDRLGEMNQAGFTQVWLPPPADSLAPQGYLPRNMYSLNSAYGSEQALRNLIANCKEHDVLPVLDAVLNHRCATHQGAGGKWNRWEGTGMDWGEWAIDNRNPDFAGQGNHPTGDEFSGAPNIDHTNERVRSDLPSGSNGCETTSALEECALTSRRVTAGNSPESTSRRWIPSSRSENTGTRSRTARDWSTIKTLIVNGLLTGLTRQAGTAPRLISPQKASFKRRVDAPSSGVSSIVKDALQV